MTLKVENRVPTAAEFIALRAETNWGAQDRQTTQTALNASLCGAVGIRDGQTIAMVRAVGDGVLNIYIQDVIVSKNARSLGVGKALLHAFVAHLGETYPSSCIIGLFAAEGQSEFYDKFGFVSRPTLGFGPGMHATLSNLTQAALAKAHDAA
jgi:ribosomal protein S18 acetylase RimI-like enzyme